jgi:transcriptional regulator with GAF, ATPase, and Fis domain
MTRIHGISLKDTEPTSSARRRGLTRPFEFEEPLAVIPLKIKDSTIGVISINKLLVQKTQFTSMDYELFTLLAGHAATAVFSAKLYSTSARKLTTLQGFLNMLKQK